MRDSRCRWVIEVVYRCSATASTRIECLPSKSRRSTSSRPKDAGAQSTNGKLVPTNPTTTGSIALSVPPSRLRCRAACYLVLTASSCRSGAESVLKKFNKAENDERLCRANEVQRSSIARWNHLSSMWVQQNSSLSDSFRPTWTDSSNANLQRM